MQLDIYCIPRFLEQILKQRFCTNGRTFQKLINQGMILGTSAFVYRVSYGVEYAFDKDEDMLKQVPFLYL
jgi:leucyl-tRNA synthetase